MQRRKFISLFSGAAVASPLGVRAQEAQPAPLVDQIQRLSEELAKARQENAQLQAVINSMRARSPKAATSRETVIPRGHEWYVISGGTFSPEGLPIVTVISGNDVFIWDATAGKQIAVLTGHEKFVRTASFSPDDWKIVTLSEDKTARIWDPETGMERAVLHGPEGFSKYLAFNPVGWEIAWRQTTVPRASRARYVVRLRCCADTKAMWSRPASMRRERAS
jgi:hypothetical protein